MSFPAVVSVAGIGATIVSFAALAVPFLYIFTAPEGFLSLVPDAHRPDYSFAAPAALDGVEAPLLSCKPSNYRTQIVSLDPLLIYIHSFVHENEIESLLAIIDPLLESSQADKADQNTRDPDRTFSRAVLPPEDTLVQCLLTRAREFMGTLMHDGKDEIGPPQVVRYTAASKCNKAQDWYAGDDNTRTTVNHIASIRVTLHDDCTGGETYYPHVRPLTGDLSAEDGQSMSFLDRRNSGPFFKNHENGGLMFRPLQGNAIFTFDVHRNGSRDDRTKHVVLPLTEGEELAMTLWPERDSSIV